MKGGRGGEKKKEEKKGAGSSTCSALPDPTAVNNSVLPKREGVGGKGEKKGGHRKFHRHRPELLCRRLSPRGMGKREKKGGKKGSSIIN